MRAFHLAGLRSVGDRKAPQFRPSNIEPLVLPWWFSENDREIILAFYQQSLAEPPLARIAVDWYRSLGAVDRDFLRKTVERHGAGEYLVVVAIHNEEVGLDEVLAVPELQPFEHLAVTSERPLKGEMFGRLRELAGFVAETVGALYDERAEELSLPHEGRALLEPLIRVLINPVVVVEAYNALIDAHAESVTAKEQRSPAAAGFASEELRAKVYGRILGRLVSELPSQVVVALGAVARGSYGLFEVIDEASRVEVITALRARMLVREERPAKWSLVGWARWLEDEALRMAVVRRMELLEQPRALMGGAKAVLRWSHDGAEAPLGGALRDRVITTYAWLDEGQIGRVHDELAILEAEVESPAVNDEVRGYFWSAVGRLHTEGNRWTDAEKALRRSLRLLSVAGATKIVLSDTRADLARALQGEGRWREAEYEFLESLRLSREGGGSLFGRNHMARELDEDSFLRRAIERAGASLLPGATREGVRVGVPTRRWFAMRDSAIGLWENGRWSDAEPVFRQMLGFRGGGASSPIERSVVMECLARGLRDEGRWGEAEPLFHEALRLRTEAGATLVSRAVLVEHLARGLRDNGRWSEAEILFRHALRLQAAGRDTPIGLGITLYELALGMLANGREAEARAVFQDVQRCMEDASRETPGKRVWVLRQYARTLHVAHRHADAAYFETIADRIASRTPR